MLSGKSIIYGDETTDGRTEGWTLIHMQTLVCQSRHDLAINLCKLSTSLTVS